MAGGTTFHFVTDGAEAALARAQEAAGERNVSIAGGVSTLNAYLAAGIVDELRLHVVPVHRGRGAAGVRRCAGPGDGAGLQPDHAARHPPHLPAGLSRAAGRIRDFDDPAPPHHSSDLPANV